MIGAALYRAVVRALFAPFGEIGALRRRALDSLELPSGAQVLELGCGPGDMTVELLRHAAVVHAVDSSAAMLQAAKKRAPQAVFVQTDIRSYRPVAKFDATLAAFVLHELAPSEIPHVLLEAAASLKASGRLAILDHSLPGGMAGAVWRRVLHLIESHAVDSWLALDLHSLLRSAGLVIRSEELLVGGRARLLVAELSTKHGEPRGNR